MPAPTLTDAPLLPSVGYVFIAPAGTPMPSLPISNPKSPGTPWVTVGNTSLDNGISRDINGDDPALLGSWQNPALVTTRPIKTRSATLALQDFTVETYKLYYGGGTVVGNDGTTPYDEATHTARSFRIPTNSIPQEHALLIIAVDGLFQVVEHYSKAAFIGSDSVQSDPTALTEMPVTATILSDATGQYTGTVSERVAYA
jgi:hypothetical protein